jgi:hypothetical protein
MSIKEKLLYATGVLMIVCGTPFLIVGLFGDFYRTDKPDSPTLGEGIGITILMGVLPVLVGYLVCRRMKKNARGRKVEQDERSIMMLAQQHQGRLTAAELAMHTDLSVMQAQKLLEQYTIQGITSINISDTGAKVYCFRELISYDEKQRAEEV